MTIKTKVAFKNIFVSCLSFFYINNVSVSGFTQSNGLTRVVSATNPTKPGKHCMLFFTGGSNLFKPSIYGEFIEALESKNIHVYDVPFNYQISQKDIDDLYSQYNSGYENINIIGHSSGCTTMLNQCVGLRGIKNVFLLDPVNTNFFKGSKFRIHSCIP